MMMVEAEEREEYINVVDSDDEGLGESIHGDSILGDFSSDDSVSDVSSLPASSPRETTTTPSPARRCRTHFSPVQQERLERYYGDNAYPDRGELDALASRIDLNARTLQTWFQNQRARQKRALNNGRRSAAASPAKSTDSAAAGGAPYVPMTEVLIPNSPSLLPYLPPELRPLPTMPYPARAPQRRPLAMGIPGVLYPNARRPIVLQPLSVAPLPPTIASPPMMQTMSRSCPASPAAPSGAAFAKLSLRDGSLTRPLFVNTVLPPYMMPFMKGHAAAMGVPALLPRLPRATMSY
ncbi:PREDICTED: homeobox protein prophet of Pit-1-like [Priapulus caudatus]|uniref:Homeobox protein prophet of Pit-1-like n=1 Tax=Priapulus caudatus TaxID=37621 RepID=A0ABM1F5Z6_PRICU|nr:PREDICTED: homeobox protein prophet of Pit-1-like [Priapulus caudatus]